MDVQRGGAILRRLVNFLFVPEPDHSFDESRRSLPSPLRSSAYFGGDAIMTGEEATALNLMGTQLVVRPVIPPKSAP